MRKSRYIPRLVTLIGWIIFSQGRVLASSPIRVESTVRDERRFEEAKGHVFTERQILIMGFNKFAAKWVGNYKGPMFIYLDVVRKDVTRRLIGLKERERKLLTDLLDYLQKLSLQAWNVCYEDIGGGTGIMVDKVLLDTSNVDLIRDLAKHGYDQSLKRGSHQALVDRAISQLHSRIAKRDRQLDSDLKDMTESKHVGKRRAGLRKLEKCVNGFQEYSQSLPDGVKSKVAEQLIQIVQFLDGYIH